MTARPQRSLLRVELTRFRCRRAIALLGALAIVLGALFAARLIWDTRPYSASERADAVAQARMAAQSDGVQKDLANCRAHPEEYVGPGSGPDQCNEAILPAPANFLDRGPLAPADVLGGAGLALAVLMIALLVVIGATFAGADWASGSIGQQLLFESRRTRVWLAKASAVGIGCTAIAALTLAVFWVPLWVTAAQRDIAVGSGVLHEVGWHLLRTLALGAAGGLTAYALTMLLRRTAATIGVLFGLSIGAEILLGLLPWHGVGRFSPGNNATAWLLAKTTYLDPSLTCASADCDQVRTLTLWPAGLLIAVVVLVIAMVSWVAFRRRDVG